MGSMLSRGSRDFSEKANYYFNWTQRLISFLLCGEMSPSALRPSTDPVHNHTSPRVKIAVRPLQASKKRANAHHLVPHN